MKETDNFLLIRKGLFLFILVTFFHNLLNKPMNRSEIILTIIKM